MNRHALIAGLIAIVVAGIIVAAYFQTTRAPGAVQGCTMEAKICPDGSAVEREGPNCEFAECPVATTTTGGGGILPYNSGVRGTVSLGPTCPVMREPPDPECADKPYATEITVRRAGSSSVFATGKSSAAGAFEFSLPPGSYTLSAAGGTVLPRCSEKNVIVEPNAYETIILSCDTGIR